jgi:hypothetical protein
VDDEENVYSVLTILPGKKKVSKSIKKLVAKVAAGKGLSESIKKIIDNESTNIIINERLANLPAFVAKSSHEVFKKDLL